MLCIDSATERPVEGANARITIKHARPPIFKGGSYRIFTHIEGERTVIRCRGPINEPVDMEVDLNEWDGSEVLEIRLEPGEFYPKRETGLSFEEEAGEAEWGSGLEDGLRCGTKI